LKKYVEKASKVDFTEFAAQQQDLRINGESYHIMSREFGVEPKIIDTSKYKMFMDVAAAYIYETLKGTLARSAALNKYKDANQRVIDLWRVRFKLEKKSEADSISAFLNADEKNVLPPAVRIAAIEAEHRVLNARNEYTDDSIRVQTKSIQRLVEAREGGAGIDMSVHLPPS